MFQSEKQPDRNTGKRNAENDNNKSKLSNEERYNLFFGNHLQTAQKKEDETEDELQAKMEPNYITGKRQHPETGSQDIVLSPLFSPGSNPAAQKKEEESGMGGLNPIEMLNDQKEAISKGVGMHPVQQKEIEQEKNIQKKPSETVPAKSPSTPMPENVQSKMENSFGTSFAGVNIHTNDEGAKDMGALAYTQGKDVHFAPGQYSPNTQKGQELIGHELTHVVQQQEGRVRPTKQGKGLTINDNPALENEADEMGKKAAEGERVDVTGKGCSVQMKESESNEPIPTNDQNSTKSNAAPKHGVTKIGTDIVYSKMNGKETNKRRKKTIYIPLDKELNILGEDNEGNYIVSFNIDLDVYEGYILKNSVNITPDTIGDITLTTRNEIVRTKSSGMGNGSAKSVCNINYGSDLPKELHSEIEGELDRQVGVQQSLSVVNSTVTLPFDFGGLGYITNLSDTDRKKYANKKFVYRFTRFNNGNTKDIILVEELGGLNAETDKNKQERISNANAIFNQFNLSFVEPGSDAAQANADLKSKIGKPNANAEEMIALHAKAFLALSSSEKQAIKVAVASLPKSALKDISGLRFGKKCCKLDDNNKTKAKTPNAYYSPGDHMVVLVKAGSQVVQDLFGDKEGANFINRLEFTVIHEIGHAADYSSFRKPLNKDNAERERLLLKWKEARNKAKLAIDTYNLFVRKYISSADKSKLKAKLNKLIKDKDEAKKTRDAAKGNYLAYMNALNDKKYLTQSGVGQQINFTHMPKTQNTREKIALSFGKIGEESEFSKAARHDSPEITKYASKEGIKEEFADSFALYISEPNAFKELSPELYKYYHSKYSLTED